MSKLHSDSRFTDIEDIFDNLALRAEVVSLKKLLDHCRHQITTMKGVISTLDQQVRSSEEGQNILKEYIDNIYKRIHHIEKTTELIMDNDTCYRKIIQEVALPTSQGKNKILLPPIDEVFSTSVGDDD